MFPITWGNRLRKVERRLMRFDVLRFGSNREGVEWFGFPPLAWIRFEIPRESYWSSAVNCPGRDLFHFQTNQRFCSSLGRAPNNPRRVVSYETRPKTENKTKICLPATRKKSPQPRKYQTENLFRLPPPIAFFPPICKLSPPPFCLFSNRRKMFCLFGSFFPCYIPDRVSELIFPDPARDFDTHKLLAAICLQTLSTARRDSWESGMKSLDNGWELSTSSRSMFKDSSRWWVLTLIV